MAAGDVGLAYRVSLEGKPLIAPSRLGLDLEAGGGAPRILNFATRSVYDAWEQPWGEARRIVNRFNELRVEVAHGDAHEPDYAVILRTYDDGIAFRYELMPVASGTQAASILVDRSEFALTGGSFRSWWIPAWGQARDEYITRATPLAEMAADPVARAVHTPLTMQRDDGVAIALHEAALRGFPAMVLVPERGDRLRAQLVPAADGSPVTVERPFVTPWRTIQLGSAPIDLLNSRMILNLADPPSEIAPSTIKPMKYIGIWWDYIAGVLDRTAGERYGSTTQNAIAHVDFAADNGIGGVLVESWNQGWEGWPASDPRTMSFVKANPQFDLAAVAAHARKRGVELILHHETSGDISHYESQAEAAFSLLEANGIHYVKTGYVARQPGLRHIVNGRERREWHYSRAMVDHEWRLAELARKHGVGLIAHEAVKDTGMRRTYPNFLARESARGQEYNGFDAVNGGNPLDHEVTLAFTRMLAGPMDYTPGIFDVDLSELPGVRGLAQRHLVRARARSTLAKQLALFVVLYSPVQMAADRIENYRREPAAFGFIRAVPVDWEDSVALAGDIGKFVVMARKDRNSDDWYLGAITDGTPRRLTQRLDFLDAGRKYRATVWSDAPGSAWDRNPESYRVTELIVTSEDTLKIEMGAGGGQAVRLQAL